MLRRPKTDGRGRCEDLPRCEGRFLQHLDHPDARPKASLEHRQVISAGNQARRRSESQLAARDPKRRQISSETRGTRKSSGRACVIPGCSADMQGVPRQRSDLSEPFAQLGGVMRSGARSYADPRVPQATSSAGSPRARRGLLSLRNHLDVSPGGAEERALAEER